MIMHWCLTGHRPGKTDRGMLFCDFKYIAHRGVYLVLWSLGAKGPDNCLHQIPLKFDADVSVSDGTPGFHSHRLALQSIDRGGPYSVLHIVMFQSPSCFGNTT